MLSSLPNFRRNLRSELDFFGVLPALRSVFGYAVPSVRRPQQHQQFLSRYETGAPYRGRFRPSQPLRATETFAPSQRYPPPPRPPHPTATPRPAAFLTPAPHGGGTDFGQFGQFGPRLPPPLTPNEYVASQIRDPVGPSATAFYVPLEDNYNYELEIKVSTAAPTTNLPPPPPPPPPTQASHHGRRVPSSHPFISGNGFWPDREYRLEASPPQHHPSEEGMHKIVVKVEEEEDGGRGQSQRPIRQSFFGPTSFGLPWDKHERKRKRKKEGAAAGMFAPEATAPSRLFTAPSSGAAALSYDDYLYYDSDVGKGQRRAENAHENAHEEANEKAHEEPATPRADNWALPENNTPFPEFGQRLQGWQKHQAQSLWRRMGSLGDVGEEDSVRIKRPKVRVKDDSESAATGFAFYRPQHPSQFRQQSY